MTVHPDREGSVETVVFDLGQVIVGWDPRRVWIDELGEQGTQDLLDELDFFVLNRRLDAGERWADIRPEVAARVGDRVRQMDSYVDRFDAALTGPIPGMAELVQDLLTAGVRVLGLTNWSAETFHHGVAAAPAIGQMEDVLVSGEVGLVKPDPAIYQLLIERFGLTPGQTAFTDDSPANVTAARAAGIRAEVFSSAEQWRMALRGWGVAV
ncbi:HAD family hydrolase [Ruania halotolerans]|uniref:HAD family hydrolase n=1 Tax=Ruania halotolerans TaxID=2897773 RepID=UPI001E4542D9|nr:HAD family phosphatase [Ruania halotolerans]UFU08297.1 HAD family phosphatase [Ruania halotolerans]